MTLPKTIRAELHENALTRVTRMFNATPRTVLAELLQNARRAGATEVNIRTKQTTDDTVEVTIADNGHGIGDPGVILSYGRNGWEDDTTMREDAAGMGFACLARLKCTIKSATEGNTGWMTTLEPDCFQGTKEAIVETWHEDHSQGTTVSFEMGGSIQLMNECVRKSVEFYPIPCRLVTALPDSQQTVDLIQREFLADCIYRKHWRGLEIGVQKIETRWLSEDLNFFGHRIDIVAGRTTDLDGAVWCAKVNVIRCPDLELVLPAREEAVDNEFLGTLKQECRRIIYQAVSELPADNQVFLAHEDVAAAKTLGIRLPDAPPALEPWCAPTDEDNPYRKQRVELTKQAMTVSTEIPRPLQHTLQAALAADGSMVHVFAADARMDGFEWYDQLPQITKITPAVMLDEREMPAEAYRPENLDHSKDRQRITMITLRLHLKNRKSEVRTRTITSPVLLTGEAWEWGSPDANILITDNNDWSSTGLVQLLTGAYFEFNNDCGSDNWDTQLDTFQREARYLAHDVLKEGGIEIARTIQDILNDNMVYQMAASKDMQFKINLSKGLVTVTHSETDTAAP